MVRYLLPALICMLVSAACAGEAAEDAAGEILEQLTPDDVPAQIVSAQVGDWASYVTDEGKILKLTVVERWNEHGDDHLVVQSSTRMKNAKNKKKPEISEDRVSVKERVADLRDLGINDYISRSDVLVNGRKLKAVVINYCEDGMVVRQSYFSDRVPVYGLVRGVLFEDGKRKVVLRLDDFGFADDEEE